MSQYQRNNDSLSCNECSHPPNKIIEDLQSGDTICTCCGIVLQEHIWCSDNIKLDSNKHEDFKEETKNIVMDIVNCLHLNGNQCLINDIFNTMKSIGKCDSLSSYSTTARKRIAYVIWETTKKHFIICPIQRIASLLSVKTNDILFLEKKLNRNMINICEPSISQYVEHYLCFFSLSFQMKTLIKKLTCITERVLCGRKPNTCIAYACIQTFNFCKRNDVIIPTYIDNNFVCNILDVKLYNINKLIKIHCSLNNEIKKICKENLATLLFKKRVNIKL